MAEAKPGFIPRPIRIVGSLILSIVFLLLFFFYCFSLYRFSFPFYACGIIDARYPQAFLYPLITFKRLIHALFNSDKWTFTMDKLHYFLTLSSLATGLLFSTASMAETIPTPNVEYSAVRQLVMEQGAFTQTVHHSHGKERNEMEMEGMGMVTILRPDKKVAWQLMTMQKMYMEIDLQAANKMNGTPDDVTIEKVGSEDVDGIKTTKYKIVIKDKSEDSIIWL